MSVSPVEGVDGCEDAGGTVGGVVGGATGGVAGGVAGGVEVPLDALGSGVVGVPLDAFGSGVDMRCLPYSKVRPAVASG